jgi:single-strand DNA-binding protein
MAGLNRVFLMGNLTRNPELRYTPSGAPVAEFGLAVNRVFKGQDGSTKEETTFVELTAWGRTAELANQYLSKGRRVLIEGRLKYDQWTSSDGQRRSKLSVVVENLHFVDSRPTEGGRPGAGAEGVEPTISTPPYANNDFNAPPVDPDHPPF